MASYDSRFVEAQGEEDDVKVWRVALAATAFALFLVAMGTLIVRSESERHRRRDKACAFVCEEHGGFAFIGRQNGWGAQPACVCADSTWTPAP